MIVFTRLQEEAVIIGDGPDKIVIKILDIKPRKRPKIGITAPKDLVIEMGEKPRKKIDRLK